MEKWLEKKIAAEADLLTTVSDPLVNQLKQRHPKAKVECIRNGFDPEDCLELPQENFFQDSKFHVVYTGKIYPNKQKVDYLFEAAASLPSELKEKLSLHFCVDVPHLIQEQIKRWNGEKWVHNLGFVPRKQALQMQRDADLLLFLEWEDETKEGIVSGKVYEYLYTNNPILSIGGSIQSHNAQWLREKGAFVGGKSVSCIREYLIFFLTQKKSLPKLEGWKSEYHRQDLALKLLNLLLDLFRN